MLPIVKEIPLHDNGNFDLNEFIRIFSVNEFTISDINYLFLFLSLDIPLDETAEVLAFIRWTKLTLQT